MVSLAPAAGAQTASQTTSTGPTGDQYSQEPADGAGRGSDALPEEVPLPQVSARAWVIIDPETGEVLAGDNATQEAPMASTTKIMTALIVLENADLDEDVTVSRNAASFAIPAYSNAGLREGDVLSVRDMLRAALIVSGNDAAVALAEHVGGDVDGFVAMMNEEARRLGLDETSFENPTGLDARGHYSSARDLAALARATMDYSLFRRITTTKYTAVYTAEGREIPLSNVNELLYSYPAATGVKTGTSPAAGPSLVASATVADEDYISVVLDAPDRYGESTDILDYGFAAYDRRSLVTEGERYDSIQAPYRRDEEVPLVASKGIAALVDSDSRVKTSTSVMEDLPPSARRGDRLGEVVLRVDGERVGRVALVADAAYEEAPVWQRAWYSVSELWK